MPSPPFTGPFRTATGLRAGLTRNVLRGPTVTRVSRGVYLPTGIEAGLGIQVAAMLLVLPGDGVVTSLTALHLHGVTIGDPRPFRVVTATGLQTRREGVRLIRARLPPHRHRVATPVAAWLAACVEIDLVDAVAAADWIVHLGFSSPASLVEAATAARGRGSRLARRAAGLARTGVESPRETRLRLIVVLAGLPTPRCNVTLGTDGFAIGRVDMLFDGFQVILEYDGDQHRSDRRQWNNDLDRDDRFGDEGYLTLRVTSLRMRRPREVVLRLHQLLVRQGYQGPPPVFTPEWSLLFEPGAAIVT